MKTKLLMLAGASILSLNAFATDYEATGDPATFEIKLYKFALSENEDCSDLTTIYEDDDPDYIDFKESPSIGEESIAQGTYKCAAFEMSKTIHYSYTEAVGTGCTTTDTDIDLVVCQEGNSYLPLGSYDLEDLETCGAASEDETVTVYLSIDSVSEGGDDSWWQPDEDDDYTYCAGSAFIPPSSTFGVAKVVYDNDGNATYTQGDTDTCGTSYAGEATENYNGFTLGSALTVAANVTGTFLVDSDDKVSSYYESNDAAYTCDMQPPTFSFSMSDTE